MESHLAKLLRRSRPHRRAVTSSSGNGTLEKRDTAKLVGKRQSPFSPEQMSQIQAENSREASARAAAQTAGASSARGANPATPVTAGATEAVGGAPSRVQSAPAATSAAPASSAVASSSAAPPSSSVRASSSTSSARPTSSSTSLRPSSSSTPSTTSTSSSIRPSVLTVTSSRASTTSASSSASSSASAAAASQSSSSSKLSTGAIAGIALAVLVGLVILGSIVGWLYRKHAQRKYATKAAPWSKLDDDVTPFPPSGMEKQSYLPPDEDIYGQSAAPVIGSRRALAMARDNAFRPDGSMRPDSDYMIPRDNNRAGFGAGHGLGGAQYGAYPAMHSPGAYDYGRPTYGYGQDPSAVTQDYDYNQPGMAVTAPGNTRQLVGPGGQPQSHMSPMPTPMPLGPVAMGRPAPPQSAAEFADREEFMDLPRPAPAATNNSGNSAAHLSQYSTYGLAYADSEPDYMPHTATTTGWSGDAKVPPQSALPTIEPASPLMSGFDFQKRQSQPLGPIAANFASKYGPSSNNTSTLPMYEDEDESSRQKRMYGEVAHAAGVQEPVTPHTADLSHSTNSYETASSFSAHEPSNRSVSGSTPQRLPRAPLPNLPIVNLTPPQPYQHGQPLSPLPEVETPASTIVTGTGLGAPLTSSSLMHGQEINPFETISTDQTLLSTPRAHALRPPHSAASTTGATSFPSPSYPPPSPGGMSVPGSVSDSPRHRRESMFESDDAYGGI